LLALIAASGANARYRRLQDWLVRLAVTGRIGRGDLRDRFLRARAKAIRIERLRDYYAEKLGEMAKLSAEEQLNRIRDCGWKSASSLLRSLMAEVRLSDGRDLVDRSTSGDTAGRNPTLDQAYDDAMNAYVPRAYGGKVTILWPAELEAADGDPGLGWRDVAPSVQVHTVPGGHLTCLTKYIGELSACLKECLAGAATTGQLDRKISL
jgi:hypothetical protein